MKNKSIQFIFFFIFFTVILDFIVGGIYETMYFSDKSKKNDRLIYSLLGTNENILVFGSSRALHHYNPRILEDSLNMTCHNVGSGGQNIFFHLALLESTLERYTPQIVILELMSIDFEVTPPQWDTEKLGVLQPFAEKSEAAYQGILRRGEQEKFKMVSSVYPFNSLQYSMFRNNLWPVRHNYKGFIPIQKNWNKPLAEENKTKINETDTAKFNALFKFVETCKENKIKLFVFVSPHYLKKNDSVYDDMSHKLWNNYGIKVYNFENDSIFLKHPEYFADPFHLNEKGANTYTKKIISFLN